VEREQVIDHEAGAIDQDAAGVHPLDAADQDARGRVLAAEGDVEALEGAATVLAAGAVEVPAPEAPLELIAVGEGVDVPLALVVQLDLGEAVWDGRDVQRAAIEEQRRERAANAGGQADSGACSSGRWLRMASRMSIKRSCRGAPVRRPAGVTQPRG
jgi:hypothetical protein